MTSGRVDHGFWWIFHTHLLQQLEETAALREVLVENTRKSANWDQILPGTRDSLTRIAQNFRIGVISNSDGKIEYVLSRCGIADCFESITDSGTVGVEKPRPEIFEAALSAMQARAVKVCTWATCTPWTMWGPATREWKQSCSTCPAPTAIVNCHAWNRSNSWKPGCGKADPLEKDDPTTPKSGDRGNRCASSHRCCAVVRFRGEQRNTRRPRRAPVRHSRDRAPG